LQGIYQFLVIQRAGELSDPPLTASAISKQLGEDPAFKKCQSDLFTTIFNGVIQQNHELDALITPELDRPLNELSPVEHAAMLIGTYELASDLSVPYKVAINEAVELAKTFGGTDGHKYVNGVLDQLAQKLRASELAAN
jgi:N utilization substance protein B